MLGRYGTLAAVDKWKDDVLAADLKTAAANHQLYMPVVFPGFSWHNLKRTAKENQIPRLGGEFLWRQAYNAKMAGATVLKIAMFDEVDEGTAILKAVPASQPGARSGLLADPRCRWRGPAERLVSPARRRDHPDVSR